MCFKAGIPWVDRKSETLNTAHCIRAPDKVLSPTYILIPATCHRLGARLQSLLPWGVLQDPLAGLLPPCRLAWGSASSAGKDQRVNIMGLVDHSVPAPVAG